MVDREIPTNLAWIHVSHFEKTTDGRATDTRALTGALLTQSNRAKKKLKSLVIGKLRRSARVCHTNV